MQGTGPSARAAAARTVAPSPARPRTPPHAPGGSPHRAAGAGCGGEAVAGFEGRGVVRTRDAAGDATRKSRAHRSRDRFGAAKRGSRPAGHPASGTIFGGAAHALQPLEKHLRVPCRPPAHGLVGVAGEGGQGLGRRTNVDGEGELEGAGGDLRCLAAGPSGVELCRDCGPGFRQPRQAQARPVQDVQGRTHGAITEAEKNVREE